MRIIRLQAGDEQVVFAASRLFDHPPTEAWTTRFLSNETHNLLVAVNDDRLVGLTTGVETIHPDKGTEMFLTDFGSQKGNSAAPIR